MLLDIDDPAAPRGARCSNTTVPRAQAVMSALTGTLIGDEGHPLVQVDEFPLQRVGREILDHGEVDVRIDPGPSLPDHCG